MLIYITIPGWYVYLYAMPSLCISKYGANVHFTKKKKYGGQCFAVSVYVDKMFHLVLCNLKVQKYFFFVLLNLGISNNLPANYVIGLNCNF